MPAVSLIVPVRDEARNLTPLLAEIRLALRQARVRDYEVLVIDDGSRDGSWDVVAQLARRNARLRGLRLAGRSGKTAALAAGFAAAKGEVVVTLDGDLQDSPREITKLLAKLEEGWDVVSGWKRIRADARWRVVGSRLFNSLVSAVFGLRLHDHNCGLKAYRAKVVPSLRLRSEWHRFLTVLAFRQGFRVTEVAVEHRRRRFGKSKYGVWRIARGIFDLLWIRFLPRAGAPARFRIVDKTKRLKRAA